jgi:two-component sensor histidine kinase
MTIPIAATGRELQRSNRHVASRETGIWKDYAKTKVELAAALLRERELLREKSALLQRQDMLAQEFEHRLLNSLQVIVSLLLSLQSRAATTVEAAAQLSIAAERVAACGRVHRRLHLLDHQKSVGFKPYLQHCGPGLRHAEMLSIANLILTPQVEQTFGAKKECVAWMLSY